MTALPSIADAVRKMIGDQSSNNAVRVGVDVVDVAYLQRQLNGRAGARFLSTRFTPGELRDSAGQVDRLAGRWAAKEAVAKAIGSGFRQLAPAMIEITKDSGGRPGVRRADSRVWPHSAHMWAWQISMAHEGGAAIAVAIALASDAKTLSRESIGFDGSPFLEYGPLKEYDA